MAVKLISFLIHPLHIFLFGKYQRDSIICSMYLYLEMIIEILIQHDIHILSYAHYKCTKYLLFTFTYYVHRVFGRFQHSN